jgi:7 transmembrane receptor (rhodopsin family)
MFPFSRSASLSAVQWIVFAFGTVSNLLVVLVMLWHRPKTQLVTQLLVGSLAVANIGMMFGVAWIQAVLHIDVNWKFGLYWCKTFYFLMGLTVSCSTWTLAVVAADR